MPINSFDNYPLTWKPDKTKLTPPYYQSLTNLLTQDIQQNLLAPGTKLPPQRELADFLDLHYTTITRVYDLCKKKGLIYGITGKGTFVSPTLSEDTDFSEDAPVQQGIDLGGIGDFGGQNPLIKATQRVLDKGFLQRMYTHNTLTGYPHQLAAGKRWLEQLGVEVDHEHLLICSGAQNALTITLMSLFSPGERIATDVYTYSNFIELAKLLHLQLVPISGDAEGMSAEILAHTCKQKKLHGIYLMPTCANPTTITISTRRRRELAEIICQEGLIVIEDDISSSLFVENGSPLHPPMFQLLPEQSVYISSITKSLCGNLRIAYLAFAKKLRPQLLHGLFNIEIRASALDAEIATELILSGEAYTIIQRKRNAAKKANALFDMIFPELANEPHSPYALFRWLPVIPAENNDDVEQKLQAAGVRVYHARHFSPNPLTQSFLRISLSSAGSMKKLEQGLRLVKALTYPTP